MADSILRPALSMRDAFFDELFRIASADRNVFLVSADCGAPSLDKFRSELPEQFINVGIAEANMVTVAAGLALSGKNVFTYAIMPFATLRCFEILKVTMSLMKLNITVVGIGAGFSYDDSGPTHHSTEDVSVMRVLPGVTIFNATDSKMAAGFARKAYERMSPVYVRLDREILPVIYSDDNGYESGLHILSEGEDIIIVSTGNMVHLSLELIRELKKKGISAGLIDLYRLKPVNTDLLLKNIATVNRIVSIEEHMLAGGVGSIIAEIIADNNSSAALKRFGILDSYYYSYGGRSEIRKNCGLAMKDLLTEISVWLKDLE